MKSIIYLNNSNGETIRSIKVAGENLYFITMSDSDRIEITDNIEELESENIPFTLLKTVNKAALLKNSSIPLDFTQNQLSLVWESVQILENVSTPEDNPQKFKSILKKTLTLGVLLIALLFSSDFIYTHFIKSPEITKKEIEIVTVMDRKQIKELTVAAKEQFVKPTSQKISIHEKRRIKTTLALRSSKNQKPRKTVQISQLGALGVLGSLKSSQQKGGLNLNNVKVSKGIGLGGTQGSGGVQTTNYARGLFAAPLGSGNNANGAGGYGTKGKGGGQAGYGKMNITGSYGSSVLPVYEEALSEGGLDRNAIAAVIARHLSEVRFCYESALQQRPQLNGRVSMKFVINPRGQVSTAQVGNSSLGHVPVENCIRDRLKSWKFPEPQGGVNVKVSYPFVLKRVSDS